MEIRYPNYYRKFQCIAGACPDTCCAGWEIAVDEESEKRYRAARRSGTMKNKEFARKLKRYIKRGRIISEDVTCPFLNHEGLCDMYIERFLLMSDFMEEFAGLETICRDWPDMLEKCRAKLYHSDNSRNDYAEKRCHMLAERSEAEPDARKTFEYFVYSFALSSLYDGDLLTKVKMAVLCTMAIEELYMAADESDLAADGKAAENDSWNLTARAYICHSIARQIENCDENRMVLERFLKQESFSARSVIDALAMGI